MCCSMNSVIEPATDCIATNQTDHSEPQTNPQVCAEWYNDTEHWENQQLTGKGNKVPYTNIQ